MLTDSEMRGYYWVWREVIFSAGIHRLINAVPLPQSAAAVMYSISMVCVYWTMGMLSPMLFFDGRYGGEEAAYPG
jgi:hypothetical protein